MEYIGELSNGKKFENTNDVEKEFFVLMNQINLFLIDSSNNLERIFSLSKKENEQWNVDGMLQIFMRLVEQFQLFIAKIEWDRIKKETRVFSLPLKNKQTENLYIEILSENLKTICQPDENTEEMEKVDAKVESSNEFSEFSTILNSEFTVAKKLQLVLEELDKKYKGHLPNSVMTSTQKRYIYSTIDTIHPNGKNFFALKKYVSLINNKVYYIETNFSKEYGNLIAQRMIRQVKEYNTEKA